MIDLHAHILPGIDDGPLDLASALDMARSMVGAGITTVTATPHIYPAMGWEPDRARVLEGVAELQQALAAASIDLQLLPSAEHFLDERLPGRIERGEAVPINLKRYLLVELALSGLPPDLPGLLFGLRRQGVEPLLAHVERYAELLGRADLFESLRQQGYLFQVDAGALTGAFGWRQKRTAWQLVERGQIAVVASDAHRAGDVEQTVVRARTLLERKLGLERARRLLVDNPQTLVDGEALDVVA